MEDKQFLTQFIAVFAGLLIFTVSILVIAYNFAIKDKYLDDPTMKSQVLQRIEPVAKVNVGEVPVMETASAGASKADQTPEQIYQNVCAACHASGILEAPKLGDSAAWAERLQKGKDTLYQHAINGFNAMPPRGGAADLTDEQVHAVVDYLVGE